MDRTGIDALTPAREPHAPTLAVGEGDWEWWSCVGLRSAGFPASGVERLSSSRLAEEADRLNLTHPDAGGPAALADADGTWADFRHTYQAEVGVIAGAIRGIATDDRFREALMWQNHILFETAIPRLLELDGSGARNRKQRKLEELVASYWQRYCMKNDTIGFFGPVGWARIAKDLVTQVSPGTEIAVNPQVYFEAWSLDVLADQISMDRVARCWIPPCRMPYLGLEGNMVVLPQERITVTETEASVLTACNGADTAAKIAALLLEAAVVRSEDEVFCLLESLVKRKWITWKLELPVSPRPQDDLAKFIQSIGDSNARERAATKLAELLQAKAEVEAEVGNPAELYSALKRLDATFERVTGVSAARLGGRTHAARTLTYLDCRRDADVRFGHELVEALEPLSLLLESVRWFTYSLAERVVALLTEIYDRITDGSSSRVRLSAFWFEAMTLLHGDVPSIADELILELQRRWGVALGEATGASHVVMHEATVRRKLGAQFEVPHAGWGGARYCSPDVMISATDAAALRRGEFDVVLGEIHVAVNTLRNACWLAQHPTPADLVEALARDFPSRRLLQVQPKDVPPLITPRLHPALVREDDVHVALVHQTVDRSVNDVRMSADLEVSRRGEQLVVCVDGSEFNILDVFSESLMGVVVDRFRLVPRLQHTPRIQIGRLVVTRQAWCIASSEISCAFDDDEARRYARFRRWRADRNLPLQVFVRSPCEIKPVFVDFGSPVLVSLLAKMIRRAADERPDGLLEFVELLPTQDCLWLVDKRGDTYTSELRLVAIDRRGTP